MGNGSGSYWNSMVNMYIMYAFIGVVNGKCETLQEGDTSIFLCEPETF